MSSSSVCLLLCYILSSLPKIIFSLKDHTPSFFTNIIKNQLAGLKRVSFMGWKVVCSFVILVLDLFIINSASCSRLAKQTDTDHYVGTVKKQQLHKKDIINPTATVPTIIPASTTVMNPTSVPDTTTINNPPTTNTPTSLSGSWCIASEGASRAAVQLALDYACGYGGADCTAIQPNGVCYNPSTVRDHASYAFNQYYQKNPIPTSCNFGGTAVVTSTDPSTGSCQYKSTSTSSSILNITNTSGATVFGAHVPSGPSTSEALRRRTHILSSLTPFFLALLGLYLNDPWCIWKTGDCLW